jgi:hypothetical protein
MGRDEGCWREVCINMACAPPFELVSTAIPVDLRIENSDNARKGFYGASPDRRKRLCRRRGARSEHLVVHEIMFGSCTQSMIRNAETSVLLMH